MVKMPISDRPNQLRLSAENASKFDISPQSLMPDETNRFLGA